MPTVPAVPAINPLVVDLSSYQNVQDWDKVKAWGIRGIINKVTEGSTLVDRTFGLRRDPVLRRGLLYGAYHFLRRGSMQRQAEFFLTSVGDPTGVLLALDHEDNRVSLEDAKLWMRIVEDKTGQSPVLYSGFVLKEQLAGKGKDQELGRRRLWLAHYSSRPTWPNSWLKPWLHQYTGDGSGPKPQAVDGIAGAGLDMNSFQGDEHQLAAEWLGAPAASAVVKPASQC